MHLSVVIPVYNEQKNIEPLIGSLQNALANIEYELIFVDDGSQDNTVQEIERVSAQNVTIVAFSRNFGQTSAMASGIEVARGTYIATIDGDLQNDPADIPLMLEKLINEKLDIVVGKRKKRQDGMLLRKIPSKIANMLIRKISGVSISDYGCTLKLFHAEMAKKLDLYGELHRFVPILANMYGARIAEMDVRHHPRIYGTSKYGIGRTLRVVSDLLLMYFFQKYRQNPMHLFGGLGIMMFTGGSLIEGYLLLQKMLGQSIGTRPLFYVGILLIITGVQLITTGFVAELIMRTYYGSQNKKPYDIAQIIKKK